MNVYAIRSEKYPGNPACLVVASQAWVAIKKYEEWYFKKEKEHDTAREVTLIGEIDVS